MACLAGLSVMCFSLNGYSEFAYRGGMLLAAVLTAVSVSCLCRPGSVTARVSGARPWPRLVSARLPSTYGTIRS